MVGRGLAVTALMPGDAQLAAPQNSSAGPPTATPKLLAQSLSKTYGSTTALKPTDLTVAAGELMTVLGPSGSGKTTLLQIVCGLVEPTGGRLHHRRHGPDAHAGPSPAHRRGVPELRAVPAPDGGGERRLPPADAPHGRRRTARPRSPPRWRWSASAPCKRAFSARTLGRPAAARGARALLRLPALADPDGRAARRARPQAAGRPCRSRSSACTATPGPPSCSSPTTRKRRWRCRTASA